LGSIIKLKEKKMSEAAANPEYNPSGVGDCIDTNKLPWIPIPNAPGMSI
jgi:hypothetical protein